MQMNILETVSVLVMDWSITEMEKPYLIAKK